MNKTTPILASALATDHYHARNITDTLHNLHSMSNTLTRDLASDLKSTHSINSSNTILTLSINLAGVIEHARDLAHNLAHEIKQII